MVIMLLFVAEIKAKEASLPPFLVFKFKDRNTLQTNVISGISEG